MDPESSLYIMSPLAHQKYTLSDGSFREIKHNTVPWNLFFNKRSGAVVMSPDSEGLGAAVVASHSPVVFKLNVPFLTEYRNCLKSVFSEKKNKKTYTQ